MGVFCWSSASSSGRSGLEIITPWPIKLAVDFAPLRLPLPSGVSWLERLPWSGRPPGTLAWLAAGTLLIVLASWLAKLGQSYVQTGLGGWLTSTLGRLLFEHLQRLTLSYHRRAPVGDLVKRVTSDTGCARDLWISTLIPALVSSATLASMFAVMWWIDPLLSIVALLVAPLHLIAIRGYSTSMTDRSYREFTAQGAMMSAAEQVLSALPLVQAYGQEDREVRRFTEATRLSGLAYFRSIVARIQFSFAVGAVNAVGRGTMLGLSAGFVLAGRISIGDMLVFLSYLLALYGPIEALANLTASHATAAAGARRVFEVMDTLPTISDSPDARSLELPGGDRSVRVQFEEVAFRYDPELPVLESISFDAAPGETIAVVGESGAGKSTLASLLLRFDDPQRGRILLNGQDIRGFTLNSLRDHIAVVFQNPMLLPVSIADNIAYGRPAATTRRDSLGRPSRTGARVHYTAASRL